MKKLLFCAFVLLLAVGATAQVRIESPHPDLKIKITCCAYASGTVIIDMVLTNMGAEELVYFYADGRTTAFDDEGNQYPSGNYDISLGLANKALANVAQVTLPKEVPLKFRVQIDKVDANASSLSLVKISVDSHGAMSLKQSKPIVIRNLEFEK